MQKGRKSENAFLHSLINQRANKDNAGKKALERFHFLTCLSNCFSACLSFALAFDNTHQNEKSEVNFRKKRERICQRARCQDYRNHRCRAPRLQKVLVTASGQARPGRASKLSIFKFVFAAAVIIPPFPFATLVLFYNALINRQRTKTDRQTVLHKSQCTDSCKVNLAAITSEKATTFSSSFSSEEIDSLDN